MPDERQIILLTHEFFPQIGGIATYVREMAEALHQLGERVEVWGPHGAGEGLSVDWSVRAMPTKGNQDWSQLWKLYRYLKSHRQQLEGKVLWLVEPAPIRALALFGFDWIPENCRVWINFMGSELAQFQACWFWRYRVGKLVDRAEQISFISEVIRDSFVAWKPQVQARLVMTRCALRSDFRVERATVAKDPEKKIILTISRIHPRKGQNLVIQALNLLSDELREGLEYWIVGTGNRPRYMRKLHNMAAQSRVPVRFMGRLHGEELGNVYAAGDIFVLASLPDRFSIESFGIVYLEAGIYGKPVVAARVGGVPEAVVDGRTGLIVPPEDVQALARAIETLLRNSQQAQAMGEAGRHWAASFSWKESARQLLGK